MSEIIAHAVDLHANAGLIKRKYESLGPAYGKIGTECPPRGPVNEGPQLFYTLGYVPYSK